MSKMDAVKWTLTRDWGFESMPEAPDWEIFAKSLLTCASGDGVLADSERQWVVGFASAYGAPEEFVDMLRAWQPDGVVKERLESRETGRKSRRSLLYLAIHACSADGEYHPGEQAAVRAVAAQLGIGEDVVGQIEAVVAEEAALKAKRLRLLYDEGAPF